MDGLDSSQFLRSDTSDSFTSGTLTFNAGTSLTVNGSTSLANLILGGDTFTDLTGTELVNSGGVLTVSGLTTTQFASQNISQWVNNAGYLTSVSGLTTTNFASANVSQWTNDAGYITGLGSFTTDNLTQGTTNLYSQWVAATGGINYTGGNVGIGDSAPLFNLSVVGNAAADRLLATSLTVNPNSGRGNVDNYHLVIASQLNTSNISHAGIVFAAAHVANGGAFENVRAAIVMEPVTSRRGELAFY